MVLDFAVSMYSDGELQSAHQCVLEAFRRSRTVSEAGIRAYDFTKRMECSITNYVCNEAEHHCRSAFPLENAGAALVYVNDIPHDPLADAFGRAIGPDKLERSAQQAEDACEFWSASCRWAMVGNLTLQKLGRTLALPPWRKALVALASAKVGSLADCCSLDDKDQLELVTLKAVLMGHQLEDMALAEQRLTYLLASDVAKRCPDDAWLLAFSQTLLPKMFIPAMADHRRDPTFSNLLLELVLQLKEYTIVATEPKVRDFCSILFGIIDGWITDTLSLAPDFDWGIFGEDGAACRRSTELYEYDAHHTRMLAFVNSDPYLLTPGEAWPLALHYGDIEAARACMTKGAVGLKRALAEPNQGVEAVTLFASFSFLKGILFYLLGNGEEWAALCQTAGATFEQADATIDKWVEVPRRARPTMEISCAPPASASRSVTACACACVQGSPMCRSRGSTDDGFMISAEASSWSAKYIYLLCSNFECVSKSEVLETMPSADQLVRWSACNVGFGPATAYFQAGVCYGRSISSAGRCAASF